MVNFLIDNFTDGVYSQYQWGTPPTGTTETGGVLRVTAPSGGGTTFAVYGEKKLHDLRRGRLAAKLTMSGTRHADVYTYVGVQDYTGKIYGILCRSTDASMSGGVNQLGGTSTAASNPDTTVGIGPSWPNGNWLGWDYNETTKTLALRRSANGTTWTLMHQIVITGTPAWHPRDNHLILGATNFATGASSLVWSWDDVTYFAADADLRVKVRYNGAWVSASSKVMVNGVWKRCIPRYQTTGYDWYRPKSS